MRLFFLLGFLGAAILVGIAAYVLRGEPVPVATTAAPPAVPTATPPAPTAPTPGRPAAPVLFEFSADAGTPRSYDGGCTVVLSVRNRSRQTLSMTGIVDATSAGRTGAAPFIIQYVDPNDSGDAQLGLPIPCPGPAQVPGTLTLREISICKLGPQYYPNCLASAGPAPGPASPTGGFVIRTGAR